MKVLVTGSRVYSNYLRVKQALMDCGATIIIHGNANGADKLAKTAGKELGLLPDKIRAYPADWKRFGKRAGPLRNQEMIDREHLPEQPIDLVLAFPTADSIGTWDMVGKARLAGIPIIIHDVVR